MLDEITQLIENNPNWARTFRGQKYSDHVQWMILKTSFLPKNAKLQNRWWHISNGDYKIPLCKHCGFNVVKWNKQASEYFTYCSPECGRACSDVKAKKIATSLERYGVEHHIQATTVKDKIKKTNLEKYGVENVLHLKEFQDKIKETNLEKYGVEHPLQSEEIRNKIYSNNLDKYGSMSPVSSDEVKNKIKETNLERYGVESTLSHPETIEKIKQTNLERYGNEIAIASDEIRSKVKQTFIDRYGVEYPLQSEEILDKSRKTNLERYGSEYVLELPEIRKKIVKTNIERYNRIHLSQCHISDTSLSLLNDKEWLIDQHHTREKTLWEIAELVDVNPNTISQYCQRHGIEIKRFYQSKAERDMSGYFDNLVKTSTRNRSVLGGHELDIFFPDHNVAIEYNGLYWHSEYQKPKQYHKEKTVLCYEKGIRLIHIFEDEWLEKEELIKEKILNILGKSTKEKIFARKTKVVEVDTKTKSEFFDRNHIQGDGPSSINYGLNIESELVAVLGFIKQKDHYVLNRYATSKNVVGGFTKLLKYFEREYNSPKIITFADLRWSEGDLYYNTGFVLDKELPPDYYWCKGPKRWHKFNWRHVGMKQKLEKYDPDLSEVQNMHNHGFYRIWDCGKLRFVKN